MTDNEIINDFEKEIKYVRENEKYDDFNPIVDIDLCEDILDLIHRKDAEIERLLQKLQQAQSEAIKEFSERLKEKLQWDVEFDNKFVFESDIDNFVKEMTDVETNQRKEDEGK